MIIEESTSSRERGHLAHLAPAAIVSAPRAATPYRVKTEEKKQRIHSLLHDMERGAPWTAWIKMIQLRGRNGFFFRFTKLGTACSKDGLGLQVPVT
jgi:hypothetical protein